MKTIDDLLEQLSVISYRDRDGTPCYVVPKEEAVKQIQSLIDLKVIEGMNDTYLFMGDALMDRRIGSDRALDELRAYIKKRGLNQLASGNKKKGE